MIILIFFRSLVFALMYIPILILSSLTFIFVNLVFNSRKLDDKVIQCWAQISCRGCGVVPRLIGEENLPQGGFVALFNHTSFFDIFAILSVLPQIRFGAKIELFKIPFFGSAMRRAGALPIDRGNREVVFRIYSEAKEQLAKGHSFILAPEGTRQPTEKLGPFKAGPFIFAINSDATIVPIVVRGAAAILPKNHFLPNLRAWKSEVTVQVLEPISTAGFKIDERQKLQEFVFEKMNAVLKTQLI